MTTAIPANIKKDIAICFIPPKIKKDTTIFFIFNINIKLLLRSMPYTLNGMNYILHCTLLSKIHSLILFKTRTVGRNQ